MKKVVLIALAPFAIVLLLTVYGCITVYPAWRVIDLFLIGSGLNQPRWVAWTAGAIVGVLPLALKIIDEVLVLSITRRIGVLAMLLFALLFIMSWICALFEVVLVSAGKERVNELAAAFVILGLGLLIATIGFINAELLFVRRLLIHSKKVSSAIRLVHISDVHIGSRSVCWLQRVVDKVKSLHPDYVFISGDFIDYKGVQDSDLKPLYSLECPVYYCLGNHEAFAGVDHFTQLLSKIPSTGSLVRNTVTSKRISPEHNIQVIGIDDHERAGDMISVFNHISADLDASKFNVLIYHRPHTAAFKTVGNSGLVDLYLSGHTHDGQLFPLYFLVKIAFPYIQGLYRHKDMHMHVSPGTGTWGPICRLVNRNLVTLITVAPM